jgi:uncharacterized integral membrane protein
VPTDHWEAPMTDPKTDPSGTSPARDRKRDARLVATAVIVILLIWFCFDNYDRVKIHFWVTSAHVSLVIVILLSGLLGAAITFLAMRRRRKSET